MSFSAVRGLWASSAERMARVRSEWLAQADATARSATSASERPTPFLVAHADGMGGLSRRNAASVRR